MADNTTLYIIIGIVLLFALMNANTEPSAAGAPAMSAYLRRRTNLVPAAIDTMPEYIYTEPQSMYLRSKPLTLGVERFQQGVNLKPQYVKVCKGPKCSA
jgi:hypothetical protein